MSSRMIKYYICFCMTLLILASADAHEIRPAYLQITQTTSENYLMIWKVPVAGGRMPVISPQISGNTYIDQIGLRDEVDALTKKYQVTAEDGLEGKELHITQLERTLIDVIVRIDFINGASHTLILQPDNSSVIIPITASGISILKTFGILGVEHILYGWDHLLFVIGLLLLIRKSRQLFWAITSFTIAHSITLGLATLGHMSLPGPPVEAIIALSVLFLAREYLTQLDGKDSLTIKYPWIVAFLFGLLHGFGFAGALENIGLPGNALGLSLFSFNIGVEIGQIMIVLLVILLIKGGRRFISKWPSSLNPVPGYALGGMASFWFISRILDIAL